MPAVDLNETRINGRVDLQLIANLVRTGSRVLDLGCGDGSLLRLLIDQKQVIGRGVEISDEGIRTCIGKGLTVYLQSKTVRQCAMQLNLKPSKVRFIIATIRSQLDVEYADKVPLLPF